MLIESIAKSAKQAPRAAVTAAVVGGAGAAALAGPYVMDSHEAGMMPRRERGSVVPGAEPACERSRLSVAAGRAVPQWADAGSVHVRLGTPTDQCAGLAIGPADFDLIRRAQGWGYLAPGAGQGQATHESAARTAQAWYALRS